MLLKKLINGLKTNRYKEGGIKNLNQCQLYKKISDSLKAFKIGVYFKKKRMCGNGL
jgi:hypothetical protein